jgi:hypothetical protein
MSILEQGSHINVPAFKASDLCGSPTHIPHVRKMRKKVLAAVIATFNP